MIRIFHGWTGTLRSAAAAYLMLLHKFDTIVAMEEGRRGIYADI
jgi:hypothetical protein